MTSFQYNAICLTQPAIRLLRLLKGDDDPIRCQLFESTLDPPRHEYSAVSYTWGSASRPCDIVVNGKTMEVTKNVYLALRDLRSQEHDRVLWIDALCIDQSNNEEKGHQVQQMGSIYRNAERVIIWLGEATYDTDYIMYHLKQLEEERIKHAASGQDVSDEELYWIWLAMIDRLRTGQRDLLVEGLYSLLGRPWFKRVWIIQETANARIAEIFCGGKSVSTSIFALAPSFLQLAPDPQFQSILDVMPGPLRDGSWWAEKQDLHTLLLRFCESEATDPRDHIYALLGISSDACDSNLLEADYEKNLQDVIFDTISFLLNFNELDSPVSCFIDWSLPEFFENLDSLASKVLECAMGAGHEGVVKLLVVRHDIDVNIEVDNMTPLSWAAANGYEELVKLLLETGKVDTNSSNTGASQTPLWWAAAYGREAVVQLLLETGRFDVNFRDGEYGQTVLCCAAKGGHEAVVKLLLSTGKVYVDARNIYNRRTALSCAAKKGYEAVVRLLLETGKANPDLKDKSGRTPLSWAAKGGHEKVVMLLLMTSKVYVHSQDKDGLTPYYWALEGGHDEVMDMLASSKAQLLFKARQN